MATEGRVLVPADVTGGNPVRTVVQSTQANDEGAPSNKDAQVLVVSDPNTPANMLAVDSLGRATVIVPDVTTVGTLTAAAQAVATSMQGMSSASVQISGTWVGTISFEGSNDGGANWSPINGTSAASATPQTTATANGMYRLTPAGIKQIQAKMSAFTSGSAVVTVNTSAGMGGTFANQVLPTQGSGVSGTPAGGVTSVQGVVGGTAQPVSVAAGTNTIGATKPAPAATGTITAPALSLTSFTLLAANTNRLGATFYNDSLNTVYLAMAATATTAAYTVQLLPGGYYELPNDGTIFTGLIAGIALTATGNVRVTELT